MKIEILMNIKIFLNFVEKNFVQYEIFEDLKSLIYSIFTYNYI